ncbi:MAG: hypothetical protein KatS3mg111_4139 [Pirellulaceae bacterium]|nr:MAG: hypothetical protein KatS3mg111_4139 [Pirellulaceae bacterium]
MNPQPSSQTTLLDGGELGALTFRWLGDRYAHRWVFPTSDGVVELASIDRFDEQRNTCASPPLQQIHLQDFGDGRRVAFGVGMAGRGHWSASFTLVPDLDCWVVELACRCPIKPMWLGSSYALTCPWEIDERVAAASWQLEDCRILLEPIAPRSQLAAEENMLTICPAEISDSATTQWAFRLRRQN